jgi:hypothetical protein
MGLTVNCAATVKSLSFLVITSFLALVGCGGGGSNSGSQPPPPPPTISSVTVTPATAQVPTGGSQSFTAQVSGTGLFNPDVTWSVDGVNEGNATVGTIVGGLYTAPSAPPNPSNVMITATSVQDSTKSGSSTATVYLAVSLVSITPTAASAGEQLTINIQNPTISMIMVFSGVNGASIPASLQETSGNSFTTTVPFGATSGPVNVNYAPIQGTTLSTNSINFTRLPNLLVHVSTKDLSSGETLQLDSQLLGASIPSVVSWTSDSGNVSAQGVFQAPLVTSESFSQVTGCIQNTNSCDSILLRILPFRITPNDPIVDIGNTLQLDALQAGSQLSAQWSILAGGGSVASGGLYTAPSMASGAGPVTISAISNSTTEQASVAVSGAFAGLVNRVYDYADFTKPEPPTRKFVESISVNNNQAYALTLGLADPLLPSYAAIDVYDITNPDQPVWTGASEAVTNSSARLFTYGNTLFSMDLSEMVAYDLSSEVPTPTQILPIAEPFSWSFNNGVLYVLPTLPVGGVEASTPIDVYDLTSGMAILTQYQIPNSPNIGQLWGISGSGKTLYLSGLTNINNTPTFTIGTYDLTQSPPTLTSTVVTTNTEYHLQVAGNVLLADSQVYDISNISPVQSGSIAVPVGQVWGVEGNNVLITGGYEVPGGSANYVAVNISSPSNPVVEANVVDMTTFDIFNPKVATWAPNGRFYGADGTGGIAVYNASVTGGPAFVVAQSIYVFIYDQVLEGQTLYASALEGSGAGGVACFDLSSGTPVLLGSPFYPNDSSYSLQVSGTNVFLGLADSLKVIDASNPSAPAEVTSIAIPVNSLALSGNTLFVGTADGRLVVFDVSSPASPQQIGSVTIPPPSTIRITGNLLLVAAGQNGFLLVDITNPSTPAILSQFSPSPTAPVWDAISIGPSAVMLAADSSGIITLDTSNPASPQQLYAQQLPFENAFPAPSTGAGIVPAFSLASQSGLTYVGTSAGAMYMFDATNPALPRVVALNIIGADDTEIVSVITPGVSTLYPSVQGVTLQLDNTVPQNSILLDYPPAALTIGYPINDALPPKSALSTKFDLVKKRLGTSRHFTDRLGVLRGDTVRPMMETIGGRLY